MPEYIFHYAERIAEWKKAQNAPSQLLTNALELIDSALWLVAGGRNAQAVSALHNSIELIFKAELERVHRVLIADNRQLDYKSLKSLLKDAFLKHPQGKSLVIEDYDLEKTITFTEAFSRTKDLYPQIGKWDRQLKQLQFARNDIVHYGSDPNKKDDYAFLIAAVAFPFLVEFLALSNDIDLRKLIGQDICREVDVASAVCSDMQKSGKAGFRVALKTVQRAVLYRNVEFPQPADAQGWIKDNFDREFDTAESLKRELRGKWKGEIIDTPCQICGSIHAFAEVNDFDEAEVFDMAPMSLACAVCGLDLSREDAPLPQIHYGLISAADIEKSMRENRW